VDDIGWRALADRLGLEAVTDGLDGTLCGHVAGLTSRHGRTWLGLVVANPHGHRWALTRRWEPQARAPRRPDAKTIRFKDQRLTERYVGTAEDPVWFRETIPDSAVETLVAAADANRLGACALELRTHVLRAQFRQSPNQIPDLPETMAALRTLAEALDGPEPGLPDLQRVPLLNLTDLEASPARLIDCSPDRIVVHMTSSTKGLSRLLRRPVPATIDWSQSHVSLSDWRGHTRCLRQIIVWESADWLTLSAIDLAGAPIFTARSTGRRGSARTCHGNVAPWVVAGTA